MAIALAGLPLITNAYRALISPTTSAGQILAREGAIALLLVLLLWIAVWREGRPLASIGLSLRKPGQTLLWSLGLLLALVAGVFAAMGLISLMGLSYGGEAKGGFVTPMGVTLLVVLRAGLVEEIFYRGYAMERLTMLTGSRALAAALPLAAFTLSHANGGVAGMLIALILGGILTGFYQWKRNLPAAILAHFLIDFIPNILLPLLGGD